jgi:hypothetical protein
VDAEVYYQIRETKEEQQHEEEDNGSSKDKAALTKVSSSTNKENLGQDFTHSRQSHEEDISYLSKIQNNSSLVFDPSATISKPVSGFKRERLDLALHQPPTSNSFVNISNNSSKAKQVMTPEPIDSDVPRKKESAADPNNKAECSIPEATKDISDLPPNQTPHGIKQHFINPALRSSKESTDSLIIFNPHEQAILDQAPNMTQQSHRKSLEN